jgi:hypothetical protein
MRTAGICEQVGKPAELAHSGELISAVEEAEEVEALKEVGGAES